MQTVTIELFKFNELSAEAQQVAINNLSSINVDYDWYAFIYEDAKNVGLKITSFELDRHRHATGIFIDSATYCANKIISEHGETCETYKTAQNYLREIAVIDMSEDNDYYQELEDIQGDFLKDILENYSIMLQKECEYLQSEEAIKETIIANEYDFTIDGKRY